MKNRKRKIYVLAVVLGLTMVWLGFLYTYELNIVAHKVPADQQAPVELQHNLQHTNSDSQAAGFNADAVTEAGSGFPLVLAGLGMVFILGGVVTYRHRE